MSCEAAAKVKPKARPLRALGCVEHNCPESRSGDYIIFRGISPQTLLTQGPQSLALGLVLTAASQLVE